MSKRPRSMWWGLLTVLALGLPHAQAADKVSIVMSWVAQAEHGGFYQALATGIYARYGLDVSAITRPIVIQTF